MFDPCSYPGIQCKFYYNNDLGIQTGMQITSENKEKYTNITTVSFMIFRTGSVLIVGMCDEPVLEYIYTFLNNILRIEFGYICDKIISPGDLIDKKKKKKIRKKIIYVLKDETEEAEEEKEKEDGVKEGQSMDILVPELGLTLDSDTDTDTNTVTDIDTNIELQLPVEPVPVKKQRKPRQTKPKPTTYENPEPKTTKKMKTKAVKEKAVKEKAVKEKETTNKKRKRMLFETNVTNTKKQLTNNGNN